MKKTLALTLVVVIIFMLTGCNTPESESSNRGSNISENPETTSLPNTAINTSTRVGDIVQFGGYDWRVLDIENGKALIIVDSIIDWGAYNEEDGDTTWAECSLRNYLNNEFYNSFSSDEMFRISATEVNNNNNSWFDSTGGEATSDYIFLLSIDELIRYFGDSDAPNNWDGYSWSAHSQNFSDEYNENRKAVLNMTEEQIKSASERISESDFCVYTEEEMQKRLTDNIGTIGGWWLRTPGLSGSHAAHVSANGSVMVAGTLGAGGPYTISLGHGPMIDFLGIRPSMWVTLDANSIENSNADDSYSTSTSVQIGNIIQFGGYDWQVMDIQGRLLCF